MTVKMSVRELLNSYYLEILATQDNPKEYDPQFHDEIINIVTSLCEQRRICEESFQETRRRVCRAMNISEGTAWNNIESYASSVERLIDELRTKLSTADALIERAKDVVNSYYKKYGCLDDWKTVDDKCSACILLKDIAESDVAKRGEK